MVQYDEDRERTLYVRQN